MYRNSEIGRIGNVIVREELLVIPTYLEPIPEELPMFAENRVHQRSSGNPYPNRVVLNVNRENKQDKAYRCIQLENEFLSIQILPELGGRIYSAYDKTTGYDFLYKQHVIKPALIGMLGSWISGGIEFNFPCHHRPSTFMPVDYFIEHEENGAVIVWLSEHDPLNRMKGMVGVRLAPGEAVFETIKKIYNRTPLRHSFLWWENAAVPVNENYQLFFPPDVNHVQFHYRKDVTSYPIATGVYNGIRMGTGIDIRYHKNTRQPTSYFCAPSRYDFFGGYDEGRRCGVVHAADRYTSVGKKMFTWAYNQLSHSWESALTDSDGMYAELMASSYSLNQPDFTWLEPYEQKVFSQYWYPIGAIGIPVCATNSIAISLKSGIVCIQATRFFRNAIVMINGVAKKIDLKPGEVYKISIKADKISTIEVYDSKNLPLLKYNPDEDAPARFPEKLKDLPSLDMLKTANECYIAGVHVSQYRDPAIQPDSYWSEALRFDPEHAFSLHALARYWYEHAFYEKAFETGMKAWNSYTTWNFHPESGDIAYTLGLISEALGKHKDSYNWYQKAAWNQDTRSRSMTRIAMLDGKEKNYSLMLKHAIEALQANTDNYLASSIAAVAEYRLGYVESAQNRLTRHLNKDALDQLARTLQYAYGGAPDSAIILTDRYQNALDIAEELFDIGEHELAQRVLSETRKTDSTSFPFRQSEIAALSASRSDDYGLACALYAHRHYREAVELWEEILKKNPDDYRTLRNLAVAYYSHMDCRNKALQFLTQAVAKRPVDEQLIWEMIYLMGRLNISPKKRLSFLDKHSAVVHREDIVIEQVRALNQDGQYNEAVKKITSRHFTPCEGGEHAVAEQYMFPLHAIGRQLIQAGDIKGALKKFQQAQILPESLGSGLWHEALLVPHRFYEAECLHLLGKKEEAIVIFDDICNLTIDYFSNMHLPELLCWQAKAHAKLGHQSRSLELLESCIVKADGLKKTRFAGYFKTTPFFISYCEPADKLCKAAYNWLLANISFAKGDKEKSATFAIACLKNEPFQLYAKLLAQKI